MRGIGAAFLGLMGLSGCATLDRGADDRVFFVSVPPGASLTTTGGQGCTTPCAIDVSRRDDILATIAKSGYRSQQVSVTTRLNANGVGDFMEDVSTAGLGMVVDTATGATLEHIPNPVSVTLIADPSAPKGTPIARR